MSSDVNDRDDDERTDPHIVAPKSQPAPSVPTRVSSPPPLSQSKAPLAPSSSPMPVMPKMPVRSIDAMTNRMSDPGRPPVLPVRPAPSAPTAAAPAPAAAPPAASPPPLPTSHTTIAHAPTMAAPAPVNPVAAPVAAPVSAPMAAPAPIPAAAAPIPERASEAPPHSSITAAMLIPRPSSVHPPAISGRVSDPGGSAGGGDAIRERLAQLEVTASATRAIATRVETEAKRANTRLDALEPKVAANETAIQGRLAQLESGLEAARKELGERVTQVQLAPPPARAPSPAEEPESTGSLKTALATLRQTLAEHERQFEARRARVEAVETRVAAVDPRLAELRRATESFDLRIVALERAQEALREGVDARLREIESRLAEGPKTGTKKVPGAEPELRRIKGIGPKYEKALREIGITTLVQVAAMGEDEMARVAAQLSVPVDRVRKLGWPETAKALLATPG